uniref:(northern house mosquito) hypothetical protein n=1 Tax=Culex pipiens TaxID=7175 RepID=A0A8D8KR27_CULPI
MYRKCNSRNIIDRFRHNRFYSSPKLGRRLRKLAVMFSFKKTFLHPVISPKEIICISTHKKLLRMHIIQNDLERFLPLLIQLGFNVLLNCFPEKFGKFRLGEIPATSFQKNFLLCKSFPCFIICCNLIIGFLLESSPKFARFRWIRFPALLVPLLNSPVVGTQMEQRSLGKFSVLGHLLLDVVEQVASALASLSELFHLVGETCLQQGLHFLGMKVDSVTLHDGHCNGTFSH